MCFLKLGFLAFLLFIQPIFGKNHTFQERLKKAEIGDFIVTEQNKIFSLIVIKSLSPHSLTIEEISIPSSHIPPNISWRKWAQEGAVGHSSWTMYEIDLTSSKLLECYSFSRKAWLKMEDKNFFSTLLNLPLNLLDIKDRKKIGPPPLENEVDRRPVWKPPQIIDGKAYKNATFNVFRTRWPEDNSPLSGKILDLYFTDFIFPHFLQVETGHMSIMIKVVDSGKNLSTPKNKLPKISPKFINNGQKTNKGIRLILNSPSHFQEFKLFLIDISERLKKIHPLEFSLTRKKDLLYFDIPHKTLKDIVQNQHLYYWLVVPVGYEEIYVETPAPLS